MNKKLRIFLCLTAAFLVTFKVMALSADGVGKSSFLLSLGRLHPVVLHLPIGILILTFFLDVWARIKSDYPSDLIGFCLTFSALSALFTSVFGYLLSLEDGYGGEVLDLHLILGVLTTVLSFVLLAIHKYRNNGMGWLYMPFFILTLISLTATGHFGSVLTHGEDFLTEHFVSGDESELVEEIDSLEIYANVIAKIMDEKCVKCHNSTKKKGDLSLVSPEMMRKGGENGEVLVAGIPGESTMYTNALLPLHHDSHMPPEGKKQLTKSELRLIRYWIENGAPTEKRVYELTQNDSINAMLKAYLIRAVHKIPLADSHDIEQARAQGFRVQAVVSGQGGLSVKFQSNQLESSELKVLQSLESQLVELDLSNTNLSDGETGLFRKFKNLEKIKLNNTGVGDETLKNLEGLERLKVLNLYDTQVTFEGLNNLLTHISPEQVYIWNTEIDRESAGLLAQKYDLEISTGVFEGFVEMARLQPPVLVNQESLFTDKIEVELTSKMKGALIRYSLDGQEPDSLSNLYSGSILIQEDTKLKARAFKAGWKSSESLVQIFEKVKHRIDSFALVDQPEVRYPGGSKIFDFKQGSLAFKDGRWTGYLGYDLDVTVFWPEDRKLSKVGFNCLENIGNWIMMPTALEVYASDQADKGFRKVGQKKLLRTSEQEIKAGDNKEPMVSRFELEIEETTAKYYKIVIKNPGVLPTWHPGAGNASWIFIDEVILW